MFHAAQNTTINGGNFINSANDSWERERYAMQSLEQHVALGAFHDSNERYDAPKCLPRTREAVFQEIANWIHVTSTEKPILWLYGPAGAGKSAIAQSIAEKAREMGCLLVATFFFARSNGERNNAKHFIPSLAYQMIQSLPCTRHFVLNTIIQNPQVFSRNLETQMTKLIVEPLHLAAAQKTSPLLIIVDGLDECQNSDDRIKFIQTLAANCQDPSFPLIFLCHSRPESDIRGAFNGAQTSQISARIVLNNQFNPDADIQRFLDHYFGEIKRTHPSRHLIPNNWPSRMAVERLVMKSSGQFIYAATVVKYVASRKHNPMQRLEVVMNVGSGSEVSPFKELDAIYRLVLSSVDDHLLDKLVRVVGMICFESRPYRVPITPAIIDEVLNLSEVGGSLLLLDDLHSLIDVGGPTGWLRPFHASFGDFLSDKSRSEKFYVDPGVPIGDHALAHFKVLLYASTIRKRVKIGSSNALECTATSLTPELLEFFEKFPWTSFLQRVFPREVLSCSKTIRPLNFLKGDSRERHHPWLSPYPSPPPYLWIPTDSKWLGEVIKLYQFCKTASELSLKLNTNDHQEWAAIYERALVGVAAWILSDLDLILCRVGPAFTHIIQILIRELFVRRLMGRTSNELDSILLDVLQTPARLPHVYHIDREQRNSAIFDTILQRFVHDETFYELAFPRSNEDLAKLLDLSDRTPYLDDLLSYLEDISFKPFRRYDDRADRGNLECLKKAIVRYKEKPISNNDDHSLHSNIDFAFLRGKSDAVQCLRGGRHLSLYFCCCDVNKHDRGWEEYAHIEFLREKYPGTESVLEKCKAQPSFKDGDRTLSLSNEGAEVSVICDIIPFRFNILTKNRG